MLWTLFAILMVVLWLVGIVINYMMYGFLHILLGIAITLILVRIIRGDPTEKPVKREQ